jgi:hypothetical protein
MFAARTYGLLWLFAAVAGGLLYLTNSFGLTATMVYGFAVSVLAGAGILVVYPALLHERVSAGGKVGR